MLSKFLLKLGPNGELYQNTSLTAIRHKLNIHLKLNKGSYVEVSTFINLNLYRQKSPYNKSFMSFSPILRYRRCKYFEIQKYYSILDSLVKKAIIVITFFRTFND